MTNPAQTAHADALLAALCGSGTIGGDLSADERREIYWAELARNLWEAKQAEETAE